MNLANLQVGDVLLYNNKWSLIDRLICLRTWSDVAHVEVYMGDGLSAASRNGKGVDLYVFRQEDLVYVLRPQIHFAYLSALDYVQKTRGTKYGWFVLANFYLSGTVKAAGVICSQFADELLSVAGVDAFPIEYPNGKITPRDFRIVSPSILKQVWAITK